MGKRMLTEQEVAKRLYEVHGETIKIVWATYISIKKKAQFIHKIHGSWWAIVDNVIRGSTSHPHEKETKRLKTCLEKYGVSHPQKSAEIREKTKKTCLDKYGINHSKRSEEGLKKIRNALKLQESIILEKIKQAHGNTVTIDLTTYVNNKTKAKFIDADCGEWWAAPGNVFSGSGHPDKTVKKAKQTFFIKYGVDNPLKRKDIAIKNARSANNCTVKFHWRTNEELVCQGSYETKIVDYLNKNQINFEWQPKTFTMPNSKTYRPDLYLIDQDVWVEIKGYFRKDAQEKWNWFKLEHPTAELWDKEKLKEMGIKVK